MAAAIDETYGAAVKTTLTPGNGGIFDVAVNGELVFRKWEAGRFPDPQEILDQIADRLQKAK